MPSSHASFLQGLLMTFFDFIGNDIEIFPSILVMMCVRGAVRRETGRRREPLYLVMALPNGTAVDDEDASPSPDDGLFKSKAFFSRRLRA